MSEWKHKDLWSRRHWTKVCCNFTVEVSRYEEEPPASGHYDGKGIHRWAVYAYIYPTHPHFANFDETQGLFQEAAAVMPLHGGVIGNASLLRWHRHKEGVISSIQVGADYDHLHDEHFTHCAGKEAANEVFEDAERLFDWLAAYTTPVKAEE